MNKLFKSKLFLNPNLNMTIQEIIKLVRKDKRIRLCKIVFSTGNLLNFLRLVLSDELNEISGELRDYN